MFSERVYRWLLVVYPRDFRREFRDPMAQLFRDRMLRDGNGIQGLIVWIQMLRDLVGSAFKEHREGVVMTKRKWFGVGLVVLLAAVIAGVGTIYAQYGDQEKLTVTVMTDTGTKTVSIAGAEDFDGAMQRAVEDGVIDQEGADKIKESLEGDGSSDVWRYDGGADDLSDVLRQAVDEGVMSQALADEIVESVEEERGSGAASVEAVTAMNGAKSFTVTGTDGLAAEMRQALEAMLIAREEAERMGKLLKSLEGDGMTWQYEGEPGGLAEAVRRAVEEGELSEELADMILEADIVLDGFDGGGAGG